MVKREVIGRYRGSLFGLFWSFLSPVFMLVIYTFVFSVVFRARWGTDGGTGKTDFAVILFVGMIVHAFFAEVLNRAPNLVLANTNFVKKVVFPLEVLPIVSLGTALFHSCVSLLVLLLAFFIFNGYVHATAVYAPFVLLPLVVMILGLAWMLASLGVFFRDVGQTIGIITTGLAFLAPVFYPVSALPPNFQPFIKLNPITLIIEQQREVLIYGRMPDFAALGLYTLIATVVAWCGYVMFQKTRKGFADVL